MQPHLFERRLTPCAEFPNDNTGLHHGAVWACVELGHVPACELPAADPPSTPDPSPSDRLPAPDPARTADRLDPDPTCDQVEPPRTDAVDSDPLDDDDEPIEIVDELALGEATDEAVDEPPSDPDAADSFGEPVAVDPFAQLVATLREVARGLGAGEDGIACLDALFGQTRLEGIAAGGRAEALLAGAVLTQGARGFARSATFTAKVLAWQGILRGETEHFAMPDGGALEPLDEWTADVLARVLGPPARADGIRRDLRRRGIAAFGLASQAA